MTDRRDHYLGPLGGQDTKQVLDEALSALGVLRNMRWDTGDAGVDLHLLTSLLEALTSRLPGAVAEARQKGCSWAEIGDLLGVTRASAWQRYSGRTTSED
jgi:hypothetical protein